MKPNRLAQESSLYLQQHAHNPVDWFPWGDEAFEKAKKEDKPVLVSIGYSACHWCHVMERESFENEVTADFMNQHFVSIKVDREERPDIDHIYMDAVQAMTGSGGWPLNVFLTPDAKPFYGGTYFPPVKAFNRASWIDVLQAVSASFIEKRGDIDDQAANLTAHLLQSNSFGQNKEEGAGEDQVFTKENTQQIFTNIMSTADRLEGGFGKAPKFPQSFTIRYLLHYHYFTKDEEALHQACLSLDKMINGGIYDQIGGGFARYSTDETWLVPHFEKMLYDNALLISVISQAFQLTQNPAYKLAIQQTMQYIQLEMLSEEGGFYSALDADSEGEEGKYYVWTKSEIDEVLGENSDEFCNFYNITKEGNWEGKNILHIRNAGHEKRVVGEQEANRHNRFEKARQKLLERRAQRIKPALDDKIILGWNALMISAACHAYAAIGDETYKKLAIDGIDFIYTRMRGKDTNYFFHTYKNGTAKFPGFLDDYAYLIAALIDLQEITGDGEYLHKAGELCNWVSDQFSEEDKSYFFYTHKDQNDVIVRKREIYDGATPSGNAMMAFNLLYLSVVFDRREWRERAMRNCKMISGVITRYPGSFGIWATLFQSFAYGIPEIALIGADIDRPRNEILRTFIPYKVLQSSTTQNSQFPLLKNKPLSSATSIFLCKDYACQKPVNQVDELLQLMGVV